jgi:ornithine carbamoyltransferase
MVFEEPSVRTRISFEAGMTQMGGHAIYYHIKESTLGKKESLEDFAQNISRYVNILMVRAKDHKTLSVIAQNSSIPVINGMTNYSHPCQAMADLMTIYEKKKKLKGLKIAYFGDALNNITHSLIFAAAITGMNIAVACPHDEKYMPSREVLDKAGKIAAKTGSFIEVTNDVKKAAEGSDIIYTDSWMSYHVQESEKNLREKIFRPFQVNSGLISMAKKDAIFMHDQPATRGMEVTSKVMDSKNSVLFDQAENRLHIQKAIILKLSMEL